MNDLMKRIQKPIEEYMELEINGNTDPGDTVILSVKYNGKDQPNVVLDFQGISPTLAASRVKKVVLDNYLPPKPNTMSDTNGDSSGFLDCKAYIERYLGVEVVGICKATNKNFEFRVLE